MPREKIAKVSVAQKAPDLADLDLDETQLTEDSRGLLSFEGLVNKHAEIVRELDEADADTHKVVQARLGQLRALRQIAELVSARLEHVNVKKLSRLVGEANELRREGLNSATSFSAAPSLPREGSEGAN